MFVYEKNKALARGGKLKILEELRVHSKFFLQPTCKTVFVVLLVAHLKISFT